uniref:Uncharacterized protein n=1 Tax=Nelumbo nucifera TaxID=4432 RepID=A0A822XG33_NELNU|nr:TPA_asm: hypothetical protein HUJ06_019439 [Nelumbo nucifera]
MVLTSVPLLMVFVIICFVVGRPKISYGSVNPLQVIEVLNPTSEEVVLVEVQSEGCFVDPGGHSVGKEPFSDRKDPGHGWGQRGQKGFL